MSEEPGTGFEHAWRYVLWLLDRRGYSSAEIDERLERKGVGAATRQRILSRLEELGLIDDRTYAEAFVRNRQGQRGRMALHRDLLRKGISEELAEEALEPLSEEVQFQAARTLLGKQAWRFEKDGPARLRSRALALLARRGFSPDVARRALEESGLLERALTRDGSTR